MWSWFVAVSVLLSFMKQAEAQGKVHIVFVVVVVGGF